MSTLPRKPLSAIVPSKAFVRRTGMPGAPIAANLPPAAQRMLARMEAREQALPRARITMPGRRR